MNFFYLVIVFFGISIQIFGKEIPLCHKSPSTNSLKEERASPSFLMADYENVAIATDLETDDVLALAILFHEANRLYKSGKKYPIDLIIVGEGNTTLKKLRMEKLMEVFFQVPPGVEVAVIEGRAAEGNLFSYDGLELFEEEEIKGIEFPQERKGDKATKALALWAKEVDDPFLIQLKPASELVFLEPEAAKKITILFYGGFNLRATALDPLVHEALGFQESFSLPEKLTVLAGFLSDRFSKVGIIEGFAVLSGEPCICPEYPWTHGIAKAILDAKDPFFSMFRTLSVNWNSYIVEKMVAKSHKDALQVSHFSPLAEKIELFSQKKIPFAEVLQVLVKQEAFSPDEELLLQKIQRNMDLVKKIIDSEIEFTMADVLVAMATTHPDLFQAAPVVLHYDASGFSKPEEDSESNLFYYKPVSREALAREVENVLTHIP